MARLGGIPHGRGRRRAREAGSGQQRRGLRGPARRAAAAAGDGRSQGPRCVAIFECALAAHRAASGGKGSGVDVAACTFGGLLRYTLPAVDARRRRGRAARGGSRGAPGRSASCSPGPLRTRGCCWREVRGLRGCPRAMWDRHLARLDAARAAAEAAISRDVRRLRTWGPSPRAGPPCWSLAAAATGAPSADRRPSRTRSTPSPRASAARGKRRARAAATCTGCDPARGRARRGGRGGAVAAGLRWLRVGVGSGGASVSNSGVTSGLRLGSRASAGPTEANDARRHHRKRHRRGHGGHRAAQASPGLEDHPGLRRVGRLLLPDGAHVRLHGPHAPAGHDALRGVVLARAAPGSRAGLGRAGGHVAAHRLRLDDGRTVAWDKLVLATGSSPNKFGWPGQDLPGVQGLYSLQDLEMLERHSVGASRAVVASAAASSASSWPRCSTAGASTSPAGSRESAYWNNALPTGRGRWWARSSARRHRPAARGPSLARGRVGPRGRCRVPHRRGRAVARPGSWASRRACARTLGAVASGLVWTRARGPGRRASADRHRRRLRLRRLRGDLRGRSLNPSPRTRRAALVHGAHAG